MSLRDYDVVSEAGVIAARAETRYTRAAWRTHQRWEQFGSLLLWGGAILCVAVCAWVAVLSLAMLLGALGG